ncbi:MAG: hypothetical protein JSS12_07955 [Verrucomicrobia bacterium]|nr:hypothetical protein [Verrucomicrobiota bacterium]
MKAAAVSPFARTREENTVTNDEKRQGFGTIGKLFKRSQRPVEEPQATPRRIALLSKRPSRSLSMDSARSPIFSTLRERVKSIRSRKNSIEAPSEPTVESPRREEPELSSEECKANIEASKGKIAALLDELSQLIPKNGLSLQEKMERIETYRSALVVILKANVCHGDLKPENILWDKENFDISDFNGGIYVDDICKLMQPQFPFESEEEKNEIKRIVHHLLGATSKPLAKVNQDLILKLIEWDILETNALDEQCTKKHIHDKSKLIQLRDYLATRFLPDSSKGYASDRYRNMMCDAFWRCEETLFRRACQLFDIRAAGLTIYAILTGISPPEDETDEQFYTMMEKRLQALGLTKEVSSTIRRMADPHSYNCPSLQELEKGFFQKKEPIVESAEVKAMKEELAQLEKLIANLKVQQEDFITLEHEGKMIKIPQLQAEADVPIAEMMQNLIKAVTEQEPPSELGITQKLRLELIHNAFENYRQEACVARLDAQKTVLLVDREDPRVCDVLLEKERIGEGGSATAHKALSLRTLKYVAIRYLKDLADPTEASNGQKLLTIIGKHKGIQEPTRMHNMQRKEDFSQFEVAPYYANCDYASSVFGDLLCSKWNITKDQQSVRRQLETIDKRMQQQYRMEDVDDFICEYGKTFTGILGPEKAMMLFDAYKTLFTMVPKLLTLGPQHEKQAADMLTTYTEDYRKMKVINKESLEALLQTVPDPQLKDAIKKQARETMVRAIRKCQSLILQECLMQTKKVAEENPVTVAKDWEKGVNTGGFGERNLDISGINRISKKLGIRAEVKENEKSKYQITLSELNQTLVSIIQTR